MWYGVEITIVFKGQSIFENIIGHSQTENDLNLIIYKSHLNPHLNVRVTDCYM